MPFDPNTVRPTGQSIKRKNRGFDPSTARPIEPSGALRGLGDLGVHAARGVLSGGQMLAAAAGAGNPVARELGQAAKGVSELLSPEAQVQELMDAAKIREAEQSGSAWDEIKAQTGAFFHHPVGSTLEAAGSIAPTLAAATLTRGRAGRALAPGLGAAQGAGAIKGRIYDEVNQYYLTQGASAEEAARKASEAQSYTGGNSNQIGLAGALGALAGSTGAESAIGRIVGATGGNVARGFTRNALATGAREASTETVQGAQVRFASNQALRGEGSAVDPY